MTRELKEFNDIKNLDIDFINANSYFKYPKYNNAIKKNMPIITFTQYLDDFIGYEIFVDYYHTDMEEIPTEDQIYFYKLAGDFRKNSKDQLNNIFSDFNHIYFSIYCINQITTCNFLKNIKKYIDNKYK